MGENRRSPRCVTSGHHGDSPVAASGRNDDLAAVSLATVGAAAAFFGLVQEWSILSSALGAVLLLIIVAGHRPQISPRTVRAGLSRLLFGATSSLALLVVVAWPIQAILEANPDWYMGPGSVAHQESDFDIAWETTVIICLVWAPLALLGAALEPKIARVLDREIPQRRPRPRRVRPKDQP
ncbi:hypothetical protein [Kocuria sabuli]|uniref:hypothetical protein n=1 Tax=Kocuria sabuli TaxID=3071448 RepID=UPI0034D48C48